jgi:hypothetical protein
MFLYKQKAIELGEPLTLERRVMEAFHCEQRYVTRAVKNTWLAEKKLRMRRNQSTNLSIIGVRTDDPIVPHGDMMVRLCPDCTQWDMPIFVKDLDLEKQHAESKNDKAVFGLKGNPRELEPRELVAKPVEKGSEDQAEDSAGDRGDRDTPLD